MKRAKEKRPTITDCASDIAEFARTMAESHGFDQDEVYNRVVASLLPSGGSVEEAAELGYNFAGEGVLLALSFSQKGDRDKALLALAGAVDSPDAQQFVDMVSKHNWKALAVASNLEEADVEDVDFDGLDFSDEDDDRPSDDEEDDQPEESRMGKALGRARRSDTAAMANLMSLSGSEAELESARTLIDAQEDDEDDED